MKRVLLFALLASATPAFAQVNQVAMPPPSTPIPLTFSGVYFPGSLWSSTGTLSPVEKGNIISMNHFEQGVAFDGIELFAVGEGTVAQQPNDWEHRTLYGGGIRFTQSLGALGMIRFNVAEVQEHRFISGITATGPQVSVDLWLGWAQKAKK